MAYVPGPARRRKAERGSNIARTARRDQRRRARARALANRPPYPPRAAARGRNAYAPGAGCDPLKMSTPPQPVQTDEQAEIARLKAALSEREASVQTPQVVQTTQPQTTLHVVEQKAMTPQGFTRPCSIDDPTILHASHCLLFVFTLGLWSPCWCMACCDKDCQRPCGTCVIFGTRI